MTSHRLLRASAGTGKTYRLVEAYLDKVTTGGLRPSEIMAITFTRKAAGELRTRVRRRLRAAKVGKELLADLAQAPISNFHGLALQMLRTFGFAGGLREGVSVLGDNGDDRSLFLEACEDVWFSGEPEVVAAVEELARFFAVDTRLAPAVWDALQRAREDDRDPDAESLLAVYDPQATRREIHEQILALRQRLESGKAALTPKTRQKVEAFVAARAPSLDLSFEEWARAWERAGALLDRRGGLRTLLEPDDLRLVKASTGKKPRTQEPAAVALAAGLRQPLALLIDTAWKAYGDAKRAQRCCDFGDLVVDVVKLLATRHDLHRAVRQRFRAVLVDEAQDTNRLQRRMVRLLAGLEGPAAGETEPANLFVVGDRKQAIYTFRGADPESFNAFTADVKEHGGEEEILKHSRRSVPELVRGINSLGASLFDAEYEALEPLEDAKEGRGLLGRAAMTWVELPDEGLTGLPAALHEAEALARLVEEEAEKGTGPGELALLLSSMSRASLYVAALARRGIPAMLGGGGGLYDQPEIADVVSLLLWLTDTTERLAAAVALRSPIIGLSDSGLLALFGRQPDDGDPLLALRRGQVPEANHDDTTVLERLAAALPEMVAAARAMGAAEYLEHVDRKLDLRAVYLALDGGEQRLANLDRLWELARDLDASGRGGVGRFAREQSERMQREHLEPVVPVPAPMRRAVTVTTVHQSKGLQYPRVILADIRNPGRADTAALRFERGHGVVFRPMVRGEPVVTPQWQRAADACRESRQAELRRLLYVATTRAEQEIFIVGTASRAARRAGFGGLLDRWRSGGEAEGVLVRRVTRQAQLSLPLADSPRPSAEDRSWAEEMVRKATPVPAPAGATFALTVTSLETYLQCPRRGFLVHDLKIPEPGYTDPRVRWPAVDDRDPPLDALTRGRLAHSILAALERCPDPTAADGFVDREIATAGYDPADSRLADLRRDVLAFVASETGRWLVALGPDRRRHELPFKLTLRAGDWLAELHGQMDLLVWDDEGPVVLDYKNARGGRLGVDAYRTQLVAYALAVERLCDVPDAIRTRLAFLRERLPPGELLVTHQMRRALEDRVAQLVETMANLRGKRQPWPGRPRPACAELACGFIFRCH